MNQGYILFVLRSWTSFFIHCEKDTAFGRSTLYFVRPGGTPSHGCIMLVSPPFCLSQLPDREFFHRGAWITRNNSISVVTVIVFNNLKCDIRQQQQKFLVLKLKYHHPEMKGNPLLGYRMQVALLSMGQCTCELCYIHVHNGSLFNNFIKWTNSTCINMDKSWKHNGEWKSK